MLPEELRVVTKISYKRKNSGKREEIQPNFLNLLQQQVHTLNEPVGRRSLAQKIGLTQGIVQGVLRNLELKGYLTGRRGRKDLSLTSTGPQVCEGAKHYYFAIKSKISCQIIFLLLALVFEIDLRHFLAKIKFLRH